MANFVSDWCELMMLDFAFIQKYILFDVLYVSFIVAIVAYAFRDDLRLIINKAKVKRYEQRDKKLQKEVDKINALVEQELRNQH